MKCRLAKLLIISFVIASSPVLAMKNPAAVYCTALGYEYKIEKSEAGEVGYCILPGNQKVDAWQFLQGKVGQDKSYCAKKGFRIKTSKSSKVCSTLMTDSCMVCVLEDGREVEVTELMGLILAETVCGDGVCGVPENFKTCPKDCPSGSSDGYCDGVKDRKCDPDCTAKQDPDCRTQGEQKK